VSQRRFWIALWCASIFAGIAIGLSIAHRHVDAPAPVVSADGSTSYAGPNPLNGAVNFSKAAFKYFYILGSGITGYKVTADGGIANVAVSKSGDIGCRTDSGVIAKNGGWMYLGCTPVWMGHESAPSVMPCKISTSGWIDPLISHKTLVGRAPFGMMLSPAGKALYVSTNDGIYQFAVHGDGSIAPLNPPVVPGGVIGSLTTISSDGKYAYATNFRKHRIYEMSVASDGTLHPLTPPFIETGPGPMEPRIDPHNRFVWCVDSLGDSVDRFQIQRGGTLKRLGPATDSLGHQPTSLQIGVDGEHAYVARYRYNSIAQYNIQQDGTFAPSDPVSAPGAGGPATFRLDPSGRFGFALNFQYDMLSLYAVNHSGTLDAANPSVALMGEHAHDILFLGK